MKNFYHNCVGVSIYQNIKYHFLKYDNNNNNHSNLIEIKSNLNSIYSLKDKKLNFLLIISVVLLLFYFCFTVKQFVISYNSIQLIIQRLNLIHFVIK